MNKAELIERLSARLGGRRQAVDALDIIVDSIIRELVAGGSVTITGFGTFERVDRAARTGRNPRTGEEVPIAPTRTPRFRPGTLFREVVLHPERLPKDGYVGGRAPATRGTSERPAAKNGMSRKVKSQGGQNGTASGDRPSKAAEVSDELVASVKAGKSGKKDRGKKG